MGPRVDLFCRVIDNLGDIGVSWRLARQLQQEKYCSVRLWVDNLQSLSRLAPGISTSLQKQQYANVTVLEWRDTTDFGAVQPPDIVIAAFSCEMPEQYLEALRQSPSTTWFQLEYLSAESWVKGFHLHTSLRSDGLAPVFFFPGFSADTGGLIREQGLIAARNRWRNNLVQSRQWLGSLGVHSDSLENARLVSLFVYPDAPVDAFVQLLDQLEQPSTLLIPEGVVTGLTSKGKSVSGKVSWTTIPFLGQTDYDRLLWSADLNLVRGEDSFVRAIWSGQPFLWHIYRQQEDTHHTKLAAWLKLAAQPESVKDAMHGWSDGVVDPNLADCLQPPVWHAWQQACEQHTQVLLEQTDLASNLLAEWAKRATITTTR